MTNTPETQLTEGNVRLATAPNDVPDIPADWRNIGVESGYKPKKAEDLNLWLVGPSGEGKTTFESSIPSQLIMDFDAGAGGVPGTRSKRVYIQNYDKYKEVTDKLIAEGLAGKAHWHRISIDTVDEWVGMIKNQLQKEKKVEDITEFGSQGHGWSLIRERCWSRLRELENAGYVWSCVGHLTTKNETNPATNQPRTVIREAVFPTMAKQITTRSDFKLTIYCINREIEKTKERKLPGGQIIEVSDGTVQKATYYVDSLTTAERDGKSRGALTMERKFEIPPVNAWDLFVEKYNAAIEQAKKQYGDKQ